MPTIGERNKNVLNIKNGKTPWKGSMGSDTYNHAQFSEWFWGVRAAVRSLAAKYLNGKFTIRKIIHSWAPTSDGNEPDKYAETVARRMGLNPDVDLALFGEHGSILNHTRLAQLIEEMAQYEQYRGFQIPDNALWSGIMLYERDFVKD